MDNSHSLTWRYQPQEVDVVIRVEARELSSGHELGAEAVHLAEQPVVHHQVVCHADAVRLTVK